MTSGDQPPNLPYGAVEDASTPTTPPPWGAAPSVPPGVPPTQSPYLTPSSRPPYAPFGPQGTTGRIVGFGCLGLIAVIVIVLLLLVVGFVRAVSGADDGGSSPAPVDDPTAQIEVPWVVTPTDIDPAATGAEFELTIDGAFTGEAYVDAGDVLVVAFGPDNVSNALAGLDADDGRVLWHRDLADVRCGDEAFDGAVMCLARVDGEWTFYRIDVATGEDLATAVAGINEVQTVHASADGLIAVGPASPAPHADLWAFGLDGERLWKVDIGTIDGAELLFDDFLASDFSGDDDAEATMERPRWRDLDDGVVMLWVTPGVALIDAATGETVIHECLRATPAHDRYYCQDDAGINQRDLSGDVVWSTPDLQLAYTADTSDARPIAVSEVYEVIPLDWETGTITGPAIHRFDPQPGGFTNTIMGPSSAGDAQAPYLVQDGKVVVALADDVDEVAWVHTMDDGYVENVLEIDGVTVLLDFTLQGLDADTGEVLWERRNPYGLYEFAHDDAIITIGFDEIARLELP